LSFSQNQRFAGNFTCFSTFFEIILTCKTLEKANHPSMTDLLFYDNFFAHPLGYFQYFLDKLCHTGAALGAARGGIGICSSGLWLTPAIKMATSRVDRW
jgi:hypothetical protein